ncbi:MAG: hypothetical protein ACOC5F_02775 [Candidatus Aminicenantaceae bacterium]
MNIRGFLVILILVVVLVYFLFFAKSGKDEEIVKDIKEFVKSKVTFTNTDMSTMAKEINAFIARTGRTPNSLNEVISTRVKLTGKKDAWGTAIKYIKISDDRFKLVSAGKDKLFNTEDDLIQTY